jgi:putative oxidoreductase
MSTSSKWVLLVGRIGLGIIFLLSGLGKLAAWNGTVAFVASKGIPEFLLVGATALELLGAVSLLTGFKARWGATALLVFLVPVTLVFHNFWGAQGSEVQEQLTQFLQNVAIAGGLFVELAAGPGALSVDAWLGSLSRRRHAEAM